MANNPYVNKVQTAGGVTLIDISDTTAVAADVAEGKYFYTADGAKATGTASGGAISVVDTLDTSGGTIRTITAVDISDTTAIAEDVAQGKYFYTADGTKTEGTASGGSGSVMYASGTVTPSANSKTISVEVDFEPTHAIIHADFTNWTFTSWQEWGNVIWDTALSSYLSLQARINNGNFQYNVTNRDISNITYSGGKFNFKDTTFNFQAGITYTWYAWREVT